MRTHLRYILSLSLIALVLAPAFSYGAGPNLIVNPSLEQASGSLPAGWFKGGWGTNQRLLTYPVPGYASEKAAKAEITQFTSGDAKWYFAPVAVKPNTQYEFSDFYQSNVTTEIDLRYTLQDGSFQYKYIATVPASSAWKQIKVTFTTPANVKEVTAFHLLFSVGSLTIDEASLREVTPAEDPAKFAQGFVTLSFDDGTRSIYDNAIPILNNAGLKSTQYIISGRFSFSGYVTQEQVLSMKNAGHEIGAHTRTHRNLTTLSASEMQSEIAGSKQDLENIGAGPITNFAYPFGSYNATVRQKVIDAGFIGARTSDGGWNLKTQDKFTLKRQGVEGNTTVAQVQQWIDQAVAQKTWLILVFHRIDNSGQQYSTTPERLSQIVNYLKQNEVPVKTMGQGLQLMN